MAYRVEIQQLSGPHPCDGHGLDQSAKIILWLGANAHMLCEECARRIYHALQHQYATGEPIKSSR